MTSLAEDAQHAGVAGGLDAIQQGGNLLAAILPLLLDMDVQRHI